MAATDPSRVSHVRGPFETCSPQLRRCPPACRPVHLPSARERTALATCRPCHLGRYTRRHRRPSAAHVRTLASCVPMSLRRRRTSREKAGSKAHELTFWRLSTPRAGVLRATPHARIRRTGNTCRPGGYCSADPDPCSGSDSSGVRSTGVALSPRHVPKLPGRTAARRSRAAYFPPSTTRPTCRATRSPGRWDGWWCARARAGVGVRPKYPERGKAPRARAVPRTRKVPRQLAESATDIPEVRTNPEEGQTPRSGP